MRVVEWLPDLGCWGFGMIAGSRSSSLGGVLRRCVVEGLRWCGRCMCSRHIGTSGVAARASGGACRRGGAIARSTSYVRFRWLLSRCCRRAFAVKVRPQHSCIVGDGQMEEKVGCDLSKGRARCVVDERRRC